MYPQKQQDTRKRYGYVVVKTPHASIKARTRTPHTCRDFRTMQLIRMLCLRELRIEDEFEIQGIELSKEGLHQRLLRISLEWVWR